MLNIEFNQVQKAAINLIQKDFRFVFTAIYNHKQLKSNYYSMMIPYLGLIVDGTEDWLTRLKRAKKTELGVPFFNDKERNHYEQLRQSIKLWEDDYESSYKRLEQSYRISDSYFKEHNDYIGKKLDKHNIFGIDLCNGIICGNTILRQYYYDDQIYDKGYGEFLKSASVIGGKYAALFDSLTKYDVDRGLSFYTKDYGRFVDSPVGNDFSYKFVLYSILCQINFLLICIDKWIINETPVKLKFEYILYYYLVNQIKHINKEHGLSFELNDRYYSDLFRNAMAHYGLGVVLKEDELLYDDPLFGLTNKILDVEYDIVRTFVRNQLTRLGNQIGAYLELPKETYIVV